MLWVFVSWAVFRISNTPAAAELTSPCTLGSGNMTGPSGPQLSDCDWSDWLHYSGLTAQAAVVSLQLEYWWLFCVMWCDIHPQAVSWEWDQALVFTPIMYYPGNYELKSSESGLDPSKIIANSIRLDLIYGPGHGRHQTSYKYLQPINNPLV